MKTVKDIMSAHPVSVQTNACADDTVEHATRLMYTRGVKRLPVTDAASPGPLF